MPNPNAERTSPTSGRPWRVPSDSDRCRSRCTLGQTFRPSSPPHEDRGTTCIGTRSAEVIVMAVDRNVIHPSCSGRFEIKVPRRGPVCAGCPEVGTRNGGRRKRDRDPAFP